MAGVTPPARRAVSVVVHGVVQGVGFRWFVRERARGLGIAGWVKNRADGSVEFVAEGDAGQLDELLSLVKTGPRGARVDQMQVDELDSATDLPRHFDIRR